MARKGKQGKPETTTSETDDPEIVIDTVDAAPPVSIPPKNARFFGSAYAPPAPKPSTATERRQARRELARNRRPVAPAVAQAAAESAPTLVGVRDWQCDVHRAHIPNCSCTGSKREPISR